jgi:uncharacterized spore protein YtfJ
MDSNFKRHVDSLMSGMESFVNSKTVVGEPIHVENTIILPLVDVSFGLAAGASEGKKADDPKNLGAGGLGAKISPSAVLVVTDGHARLVNIKNQDSLTKLIDLVPDIMERFKPKDKKEPVIKTKDDE